MERCLWIYLWTMPLGMFVGRCLRVYLWNDAYGIIVGRCLWVYLWKDAVWENVLDCTQENFLTMFDVCRSRSKSKSRSRSKSRSEGSDLGNQIFQFYPVVSINYYSSFIKLLLFQIYQVIFIPVLSSYYDSSFI